MAYAATVTITPVATQHGGEVEHGWVITVAETGANATDQWNTSAGTGITVVNPTTFPAMIRTMQLGAYLVSGTAVPGATIDPVIGAVTDPGAAANVHKANPVNGTAARSVNLSQAGGYALHCSSGVIYGRSVCSDATADHAINTQADEARPAFARRRFRYDEGAGAIALAVVDVDEGAWPHGRTRSRPVLLKPIGE
jgi:hypothetical protein